MQPSMRTKKTKYRRPRGSACESSCSSKGCHRRKESIKCSSNECHVDCFVNCNFLPKLRFILVFALHGRLRNRSAYIHNDLSYGNVHRVYTHTTNNPAQLYREYCIQVSSGPTRSSCGSLERYYTFRTLALTRLVVKTVSRISINSLPTYIQFSRR